MKVDIALGGCHRSRPAVDDSHVLDNHHWVVVDHRTVVVAHHTVGLPVVVGTVDWASGAYHLVVPLCLVAPAAVHSVLAAVVVAAVVLALRKVRDHQRAHLLMNIQAVVVE